MLTYGYCSACNTMLLIDHLEEHREDHHPDLDLIFLRLYSLSPEAQQALADQADRDLGTAP